MLLLSSSSCMRLPTYAILALVTVGVSVLAKVDTTNVDASSTAAKQRSQQQIDLANGPHARQIHHRRVQTTEAPADNRASAFFKCYSLLDEVADAASSLTQDQYLEFLELLTNGDVSAARFQDLPALFVMIYYTAACAEAENCEPGSMPSIDIGDTEDPTDDMGLFCKQVLKNTDSTAEATFEYSIRYNPDRIDEADLAVCLSKATVNVLLEQLANCDTLTDIGSSTKRRLSRDKTVESALLRSKSWSAYNAERAERALQSLGSAGTADNSTCTYTIDSVVEGIQDLPCGDEIDVGGAENQRCGFVRSKASISAAQIVQPFESLLRIQAISVLRGVINNGEFLNYFPSGDCSLA